MCISILLSSTQLVRELMILNTSSFIVPLLPILPVDKYISLNNVSYFGYCAVYFLICASTLSIVQLDVVIPFSISLRVSELICLCNRSKLCNISFIFDNKAKSDKIMCEPSCNAKPTETSNLSSTSADKITFLPSVLLSLFVANVTGMFFCVTICTKLEIARLTDANLYRLLVFLYKSKSCFLKPP